MAGAQYGYYEAIVPWDEYMQSRVLRIVGSEEKIGHAYEQYHRQRNEPSWEGTICRLHVLGSPALEKATQEWEENHYLSGPKIPSQTLRLLMNEFEEEKSELLLEAYKELQRFKTVLADIFAIANATMSAEAREEDPFYLSLADFY